MNYPTESSRAGWLLYHSVGMFPGQEDAVRAALDNFASNWCRPDLQRWDYGLAARQQVLDQWATLIGAPTDSVFAAENVTEAFAKFVGALGRQRLAGRRILIAADCFPSLHFMLRGLEPVLGFTLDTVPLAENESYVSDDAFIARWRDDVALAIVTWVTSTASKRADLTRLATHARAQGSLISVDITQGAGIFDFDVARPAVDFAASTTLKWLCGAPGTGLAYLNPALLDSALAPLVQGWFSQPDPFNWDLTRFSLASGARRFDSGTPSFLPFVASAPGLAWRLSPAAAGLRAHNLTLSHRLIEMIDAKGYRLRSPRDDAQRAGSVMADLPARIDPRELEVRLARHGILVDTRGTTVRMSPGVLTTAEALDELSALLPEA
ncbi:selenocysteine lyase/cysteine desulfurase [Paraburkholderia sp. BL23I1N1]|uniref:aminotransferase class V-fold PLP-dependent enzyme n=1 Tax=Paraburkholderia sp. BL23I1N1 TaxID=1938802 RepID=UPI000E7474A0|nr:aminotransferase class V-fold PLP-dependent enzyme [Paraburkholderia sp. BL23I1N1]RKE39478.1 selenocysteine lyase/cysteine desulfurase [Paraburkholderia sp. BL23I1N1]